MKNWFIKNKKKIKLTIKIFIVILILGWVFGLFATLEQYSFEDIKQAKTVQQDYLKYIDKWSKNLPKEYEKYSDEIELIVSKLTLINKNSLRIIKTAEMGDKLSPDDLVFLKTNGAESKEEVNILINNFYRNFFIDKYKSDIERLREDKSNATSWLNGNKINNNQRKEFSIYIDMIDMLIKEEENFLIKLEENTDINTKEINELLKPINDKYTEYTKKGELLNDLIKKL